jgi:hypothetical protein
MVTTTLAAVALSGLLVPGTSNNVLPTWEADYGKAMTTAVAQQKPMAVFIGKGANGQSGVVSDGQIPAPANQLLHDKFVCVFVNTDTPEGKTLSGQFGLNQGLVISSKGGSVQALRHTGPVTPTTLTTYLDKYSSPTVAVVATEQGGIVSTSGYAPVTAAAPVTGTMSYPFVGGCAGGNCGVMQYGGYGGCPGGNCGGGYRGRR